MAVNYTRLKEILKDVEGNVNVPYYDGSGYVTIGVGFFSFHLSRGVTQYT